MIYSTFLKKHNIIIPLFLFIFFYGCNILQDTKNESEIIAENLSSIYDEPIDTGIPLEEKKNKYESLLDGYIDKDFLMGKVKRTEHPLFTKVSTEHTERNIYLLKSVYEAYIQMYEAARKEGIDLKITSGHRTFVEQVCEWELRWNNPRTEREFDNDTEKARYLLEYRSMPGTSRHHWGTDIDLNSFRPAYFETPEGMKMYEWMKQNAHQYGFFQPYSAQDHRRPVGYCEEKWHWSYLPIAHIMLSKYLELVTIEDIRGFKGEKAVVNLDIINNWVCGIDPDMYYYH